MNAARHAPAVALLHWLGALAVLACALGGLWMVELPVSLLRLKAINWHKWLGILVLLLVLLRLALRLRSAAPPPPPAPRWQQRLATCTHGLLYLLMLAVPLLGWAASSAAGFPVHWLGWLPLPDWVPRDRALAQCLQPLHRMAALTFVGLALLHALAALKHQFIDRDGLLRRMRPW